MFAKPPTPSPSLPSPSDRQILETTDRNVRKVLRTLTADAGEDSTLEDPIEALLLWARSHEQWESRILSSFGDRLSAIEALLTEIAHSLRPTSPAS